MSNYILFKLHNPTGLINQVMSLEIAAGIQHITKKELLVHHMVNQGDNLFNNRIVPIYTPSRWQTEKLFRSHLINPDHFPHLLDLVSIPQNLDITFVDKLITNVCSSETNYDGIENFYFSESGNNADEMFTEGRKYIPLRANNNISFTSTLCWYSRFFYKRSKNLDSLLAGIQFKNEYVDLAKSIADNIGPFNSVHIRLTDHIKMFNSTDKMIDDSIAFFSDREEPVVIITDDSSHDVFKKFQNLKNIIFLDSFIVNNFGTKFTELPFHDEVVFGLINLLVGTYSKDFIGTAGSTYSGYIHRVVNQRQNNTHTFRQTNNLVPSHSVNYSWNSDEEEWLGNSRKCWWSEWKESYLNV